jgi:hypothetical protein
MNLNAYMLREQIEDRDTSQQGGLNAVLTAKGFSVFTRLNGVDAFQKVLPRVELKAEIGEATGHRIVCPDGVLRFDYFNFRLAVQATTSPQNVPANNEQHEIFLATVREAISAIGGNESLADTVNFPNVFIAEYLKDSGTSDYLREKDGTEYSTLSYDGIVCIRPSAFNN